MMRTDTEMEKRTALVLSILEGAAEENSTGMGGKVLEVELAATWERYQEEDRRREAGWMRTWRSLCRISRKALEWNMAVSQKERHVKHKLVNHYGGCDV